MASTLIVYSQKNDEHGIYLPNSKQTYRNNGLFDQIFNNTKNNYYFLRESKILLKFANFRP